MDENWDFTRQAIEAIDGTTPVDDGEEPARGNALLRLLAEESNGRLVELSPGVWVESKLAPRTTRPGE